MSNRVSNLRPITAKQIEDAARADPDAHPLTRENLRRMPRTPRAKLIRRALGLTQVEFATRYEIPLGTLRDWSKAAQNPTSLPAHISRLLHAIRRVCKRR